VSISSSHNYIKVSIYGNHLSHTLYEDNLFIRYILFVRKLFTPDIICTCYLHYL